MFYLLMLPLPPVRTAPAIFLSFSTFICENANKHSDKNTRVKKKKINSLVPPNINLKAKP